MGTPKTYRGYRMHHGCFVFADGEPRAPLPLRLDLVNHSPTGFEWGYGGSGPCQLAVAILVDVFSEEILAQCDYHEFTRDVIAKLPRESWTLTEYDVRKWLWKCNQAM